MTKTAPRLDWSRMLGFEQIVDCRAASAKIGAKVGSKTGLKVGLKVGLKI